jgi:hypothetical protein
MQAVSTLTTASKFNYGRGCAKTQMCYNISYEPVTFTPAWPT